MADERSSPGRVRRWLLWSAAALVGVLVVAVYLPAMDGGFCFDDEPNIVEAPAVHWRVLSLDGVAAVLGAARLRTRPVANLSFALNHRASGLDASAFRRVNLAIHLLVGLALGWVAWLLLAEGRRETIDRRWAAICAGACAALFLLHPLATQAVSYVVQRMTALAALFSLLALGCYLTARQRRDRAKRWLALGLTCWILALGSKEIAVALPLVLLAYEMAFHGGHWRARIADTWRGRGRLVALLLAPLVVGLVIWSAGKPVVGWSKTFPRRDFNGYERVLTQARVQLRYVGLLAWPAAGHLNLDHHVVPSRALVEPWTTLPAVIGCLALLALAVLLARRRPRYGLPLLAYAALQLLESGPLDLELMFEHRVYLPMSLLLAGLAAVLYDLTVDRRSTTRTAALAAVALLGALLGRATAERNRVWRSELALWGDVVRKSPGKARGHYNLGQALHRLGLEDRALARYRTAIALEPGYADAHSNLGSLYLSRGDERRAIDHLRAALRADPRHVSAHYNLGLAHEATGRLAQALAQFQRALALRPGHARTRYHLGLVHARLGQLDRAEAQLAAARTLDPDDPRVGVALGNIARARGDHRRAIEQYRAALRLAPEVPGAHAGLAAAYRATGQGDLAFDHLRRAAAADPTDAGLQYNLGNALMRRGRIEQAIAAYRRAVRLAPDDAAARHNLGVALQRADPQRRAPPSLP